MAEAIGNVVGAFIGADATRDAGSAQADAAREATALQRYIFDLVRQDQTPYREAGVSALGRLGDLTDAPELSAADVMAEPGYQFGLQQGIGNIENTAAARGGLYSGSTLKALNRYGQDYATQRYGEAWNRRQQEFGNRWNRLAGLAGIGQTATQQVGAAGQNFADQAGQIGMRNAANQGNLALGRANILANAVNQGASAFGRWYGGQQPPQTTYPGYNPADFDTTYADGGPVRAEGQRNALSRLLNALGVRTAAPVERAAPAASASASAPATLGERRMRDIEDAERRALGKRRGGAVRGPGGPRDDVVPALLSNGEHVIDAATVRRMGGGNAEAGHRKLTALRRLGKGA